MDFMNNRNISEDIQVSIIKYIEYQNEKLNEKSQLSKVQEVIESLTDDLRF